MRRKLKPLSLLISLAVSSIAITSCGVTGSLKTPPPIFGEKAKAPVQAEAQDADDTPIEDDRDLIEILEELED